MKSSKSMKTADFTDSSKGLISLEFLLKRVIRSEKSLLVKIHSGFDDLSTENCSPNGEPSIMSFYLENEVIQDKV